MSAKSVKQLSYTLTLYIIFIFKYFIIQVSKATKLLKANSTVFIIMSVPLPKEVPTLLLANNGHFTFYSSFSSEALSL